ncbi:hypothetical protein PENTCL1PPCAC_19603, partial [Pristionchus entomophagus]
LSLTPCKTFRMMKFAAFAMLVAMIGLTEAKMQNVTVKGSLWCNKIRYSNQLVELWERDTLEPDDLLSFTHTDFMGDFTIKGGEDEILELTTSPSTSS